MADTEKNEPEQPQGSKASFLIAFVVVTALAAGIGFGSAQFLGPTIMAKSEPESSTKDQKGQSEAQMVVTDLAPMLTNIQSPDGVWVRMEVSLLSKEAIPTETTVAIGQDLIGYLRTLRLSHIDGPSGFLTLREALDDRAIFHSKGAVDRVLIRTLLFE